MATSAELLEACLKQVEDAEAGVAHPICRTKRGTLKPPSSLEAKVKLAEAKAALHLLHTSCAGTVQTGTGRIVVLEKQRPTPKSYPRRDGEPKRAPLGVVSEKQ